MKSLKSVLKTPKLQKSQAVEDDGEDEAASLRGKTTKDILGPSGETPGSSSKD